MTTLAPASPQVSDATAERFAELSQLPGEEWTGSDLALFIRHEIDRVNGPQLPVQQEGQIISGFFSRFGSNGVKIARHAFGPGGGMWCGAPVTVRRFAEGQDAYFAEPILRTIGI